MGKFGGVEIRASKLTSKGVPKLVRDLFPG